MKQRLSFRYIIRDTFALVTTSFFNYMPGRPEIDSNTGRRLLGVDEWVDTITMRPKSVRCLGCNDRILFTRKDFDVRMWQTHRDSCKGIDDMMKKAIVKELIMLANDAEF
ncbi:uncharacterized protein BT62DRAFT_935841 [Guyanagaster necrorhizus]|uniref:Uncharacterized protein n=1 Tax=Guyanagaster necrorhizus TaxID=856835 RepID=A0A9P7VL43_9AGAR|nr:uncharacterized protein BT62DRAFT_935841 [Guyanagaster necrorhizus MCA 3950]KAG7442540.1 hypothetical protein BT62DRAFT_935841 [Guyanagaster necrorhizus MCA 3950]